MNVPNIDPKGPTMDYNTGQAFLNIVSVACEALIACSNQLNIIGRESGNEDYGTNFSRGAIAIKEAIQEKQIIGTSPFATLTQISYILGRELNNCHGQIYFLFFHAAAKAFLEYNDSEKITAHMWLDALTTANKVMIDSGTLSLGNRNMLDALIPAQLKLADELSKGSNFIDAFGAAVQAAEGSAIETTHMKLSEKEFQHPDPGAHAVGIWMRGACEATKLKLL